MTSPFKISWWRTEISGPEISRVVASLEAEKISQGPVTEEFERRLAQLLGVPHVVACTSGSTAILMALVAAGVGPGDEVIVPDRTWIATAHAVMMAGAKVVLADDDGTDDSVFVAEVRARINSRTKAVIPVHLGGRGANMVSLREIAHKNNFLLIEDAAQAFMSKNHQGLLGTQSLAGCFSLSLAKLISTGQGGFVALRDRGLYEKLRCLRNHGVEDPVHVSYTHFGFNFRFTDVLASIGLAQLDRLAANIDHVRQIHRRYREGLKAVPGIQFVEKDTGNGEIPLYAEVFCVRREELVEHLRSLGIQTRPYYPNLHLAPQIREQRAFPRAERYGREGLFLPCGPAQPMENIDITIRAVREFLNK